MFEVGFQELALIFGVSLVVLGPKKLSGLVTTVGRWVGKARSMARDFRQQLETEINLEELNKMTDLQTKRAQDNPMPTPPPEFTGESSTSTYPYSAADTPSTSDTLPTSDTPPGSDPLTSDMPPASDAWPADDTWSHAHAQGAPPLPSGEPATQAHAADGEPAQASFDLDPPEDDLSHLPPDDARRNA